MTRAHDARPVDHVVLDRVLDAVCRAPSAGLSQPVDLVVLTEAPDLAVFWDLAFPVREGYRWPRFVDALVQTLTPDAVYLMIRQARCKLPDNWLG